MLELQLFLSKLERLDIEMSPREIAEVLWLANQLEKITPSSEITSSQDPVGHEIPPNTNDSSEENPPPIKPTPSELSGQDEVKPAPSASGKNQLDSSSSSEERRFGSPPEADFSATALPNVLRLERALRPLKRRVPRVDEWELDEEKTVQRIVDEQIWLPEFKPLTNRWLELALVVDHTVSMEFWQQTVTKLEQLLIRLGAFRSIKIWQIRPKQDNLHLYLNRNINIPYKHQSLIDVSGKRVIMLVSDTVHPFWGQETIQKWVNDWGKYQPVVLLHLLPQFMWKRTTLRFAELIDLEVQGIGSPNRRYKKHYDEEQPVNKEIETPIGLPVITLDPYLMEQWVRAMIDDRRSWLRGVVLPGNVVSRSNDKPNLTPKERIAYFRSVASPEAWKLAGLLAATPLTIPLMRLVQQKMFFKPLSLAEVFISGLLEPIFLEKDLLPHEILYDFQPGARDLLLGTATLSDIANIQTMVFDFIDDSLKLSLKELMTQNGQVLPLDQVVEKYPEIQKQILQRLGGVYARLAEQTATQKRAELNALWVQSEKVGTQERLRKMYVASGGSNLTFTKPDDMAATRYAEDGQLEYPFPSRHHWSKAKELPDVVTQNPNLKEAIIKALLQTIGDGNETLSNRIAAGEALGLIGDPRIGQMVTIPAGEFIMGEDDSRPTRQTPRHSVNLPYSYQIGQYPLTNQEFAEFIKAGSYGKKQYWTEQGWQENINSGFSWEDFSHIKTWDDIQAYQEHHGWHHPRFWITDGSNSPNQPVVGVSWYEAVAYCHWRTERDHANGTLPLAEVYRLPTEAEWEKAARGMEGRLYPWGDEFNESYVNFDNNVGKVTPIGIYPQGVSPFQLYDCIGNVWEWCATKINKRYPYQIESEWSPDYLNSADWRYIRGCAWWSSYPLSIDSRCFRREEYLASKRHNHIGFRLVRAPIVLEPEKQPRKQPLTAAELQLLFAAYDNVPTAYANLRVDTPNIIAQLQSDAPIKPHYTKEGVEYYLLMLDRWVYASDLPEVVIRQPQLKPAIIEALLETIGNNDQLDDEGNVLLDDEGNPLSDNDDNLPDTLASLPDRMAAGFALGRIGDPRIGCMVTIPAGEFIMGSNEGEPHEKPRHVLHIPYDYQIGQYPVTNQEFTEFVNNGGYQQKKYWTEAGWEHKEKEIWNRPRYQNDTQFNQPNQPVIGVSWYEAVAYCHWRTEVAQRRGELAQNYLYRLPTEAEWEKAMRGTDGRIYPWGNEFSHDHLNFGNKIRQTTPIGIYPTGVSPFGVYDAVGNVGEWCTTKYEPGYKTYPYNVKEDEWSSHYLATNSLRCARGGSRASLQRDIICCTDRYRDTPHWRLDHGFRLVCAPVFYTPKKREFTQAELQALFAAYDHTPVAYAQLTPDTPDIMSGLKSDEV